MNKDQKANEAKRRSERQRKFRNKQLKEMKVKVSKPKTKLKNQRKNIEESKGS